MKNLLKKYRWLSITTTLERYIDPDYYDKLLKRYIFEGKHDLDFFVEWAMQIPEGSDVIELGPGTGRVTAVALKTIRHLKHLTLVDLSDRMIARCRERFGDNRSMRYTISDTNDFLLATNDKYDFAYSLWAFSHSVHQTLNKFGFEKGVENVRAGVTKFLTENLKKDGSFFLIHFDSLSPEQRISMKQRRRDNFVFADDHLQSPSKRLLDELFTELHATGLIDFSCIRYAGEPLEFQS